MPKELNDQQGRVRLALTPGPSLITINSCDQRKWNERNWLILVIPGR